MTGSKMEGSSAPAVRRDPYEVLCVTRDSSDQEIKSAYRKLALKYHPDKNANNPEASELFKEVAYSYGILSDPEKRRQYDMAGFEALDAEGTDMEIDLSNLGTVNTMFAALFSKLGVPIKTTVSANVLEEALNGTVTIRPLPIGTSLSGKVEKQSAHFFGVTISNEQAEAGVVVRVTSAAQSKFKLLYFEQDANGGYGLALQNLLRNRQFQFLLWRLFLVKWAIDGDVQLFVEVEFKNTEPVKEGGSNWGHQGYQESIEESI